MTGITWDTLHVAWDSVDAVWGPPPAAANTVDVLSQTGHPGTGAAIGFGIGVGLGVAFTAAWCSGWECDNALAGGALLSLLSGASGALWGALIGSLIHTDAWKPAPETGGYELVTTTQPPPQLPLDHLRVSVVPTRRGVGLAASIAF